MWYWCDESYTLCDYSLAAPPDESRRKKAEEEDQLLAKMKPYKRKRYLLERQAVELDLGSINYVAVTTWCVLYRTGRRDCSKHLQRPSTSFQMRNSCKT